jgi:pyruvate dehydrogenase (quinone)
MAEEKTAAEMMLDLLVDRWGVRHVFGLAGDGINGIMEALRKRRDDVQFVGVRHEEAAAFAASDTRSSAGGSASASRHRGRALFTS